MVEVLTYKSFSARRTTNQTPTPSPIHQAMPVVRRNGVASQPNPAVIIPVRCSTPEHGKLLQRLLSILQRQGARLIAVNDGSRFWPELPPSVEVVTFDETRGPAAARNAGIRVALASEANPVLMTDSDCIPADSWVQEAVQGFIENPFIHALSGTTVSHGATWFDGYHDINGTLNGRRFKGTNLLLYGPTCNLAVSQTVARDIAFDETFHSAACEDIDFCFRLLHAGYRLIHRRSMLVRHDFQFERNRPFSNTARFVRQFKKYASAEATLLTNQPEYHFHFGQTEEISNVDNLNGHRATNRLTPPTTVSAVVNHGSTPTSSRSTS
jgi:GT2 family glycosyltransferase